MAMIYGAAGYTGALIVEAAVQQGLSPLLAGRREAPLKALAEQYQLEYRVFDLSDVASVASQLEGVGVVLNCAGPFSQTAMPMAQACLQAKVHYLDISGEIDSFEQLRELDAAAQQAGIVITPGMGMDVVPTDLMAMALHQKLPDATHLTLALKTEAKLGPGSAKTAVEVLAKGAMKRHEGVLQSVPFAAETETIPFADGEHLTAIIPLADLSSAYVSTHIPNIRTLMAMPRGDIMGMKLMQYLKPLLRIRWFQQALQWVLGYCVKGPSATERQATPISLWGRVDNAEGQSHEMTALLDNGHNLTIQCCLEAIQFLPQSETRGFLTPAMLAQQGLSFQISKAF